MQNYLKYSAEFDKIKGRGKGEQREKQRAIYIAAAFLHDNNINYPEPGAEQKAAAALEQYPEPEREQFNKSLQFFFDVMGRLKDRLNISN